jgi:hypothetical protein
MTIDDVRRMLRRQPFQPFTIFRSDGRAPEVNNRDFVFLPERGGSFFVIAGDAFDFVYVRNITSLRSSGDPPMGGTPQRMDDAA